MCSSDLTFIACLFGFFAYLTMPREAQPDIKLPYIFIVVPFPGVSPEDAERLLVKPLEVQLQTIKGVKHMNSVARQNQAIVTLEFDPSFSTDKALADVRAKYLEIGAEPIGQSTAATASFIKEEEARWRNVIKSANVTMD